MRQLTTAEYKAVIEEESSTDKLIKALSCTHSNEELRQLVDEIEDVISER